MLTTLNVVLPSAEFPTPRLRDFTRVSTRQRATETWNSKTAQPASFRSLSVSVSSCVLGRRVTQPHVGAATTSVPAKCGGRFVNANLQDTVGVWALQKDR